MDSYNNTNQSGATTTPTMKLDVTVRPVTPKDNLLAFASVKINDCFVVDGLKICNGEKGLFVNMPSQKDGNGKYNDVCKPITKEFREQLNNAVITGYGIAIDKMQEKLQAAAEVKPSILGAVADKQKEIASQVRPPAMQGQKKDELAV